MAGFRQTRVHVSGKKSHHQIGLVQGQFGRLPLTAFLDKLVEFGFDGFELASWGVDLSRAATLDGAKALAGEIMAEVSARGLAIFSVAAHLQGQVLGDEPSTLGLQFQGGKPVELYNAWREAGNVPPKNDPYFVPPDVAEAMVVQAREDLLAAGRLAHALGLLQNRNVPVSGFVGSPARCWGQTVYTFPPPSRKIGKWELPDVRQVSLDLMVERFTPVFTLYSELGVKFGLEAHPTERAMGDLISALEVQNAFDAARFAHVFGWNFDASHMYWQLVDPGAFIQAFGDRIWSVHIKGARRSLRPTTAGILGGHQDFGDPARAWDFTTACGPRDGIDEAAVLQALNDAGFDGALSIEYEDPKANDFAGARLALARLSEIDLPPASGLFDEAFAKT